MEKHEIKQNEIMENLEVNIEPLYEEELDGSKMLVGFLHSIKCTKCNKPLAKYIEYIEHYPDNTKQLMFTMGCRHFEVSIWRETTELDLLTYRLVSNMKAIREEEDEELWLEYRRQILNAVLEINIDKNTILILPRDVK